MLYDKSPIEPPKLALRPKEAAKALGVSERTLFTLRQRGLIRGIRLGAAQGATVLYRVEELNRFLVEAEKAGEAERPAELDAEAEGGSDARSEGEA